MLGTTSPDMFIVFALMVFMFSSWDSKYVTSRSNQMKLGLKVPSPHLITFAQSLLVCFTNVE